VDDLELTLVRHYVNSALDSLDESERGRMIREKLCEAAFLLNQLLEEHDERIGDKRHKHRRL